MHQLYDFINAVCLVAYVGMGIHAIYSSIFNADRRLHIAFSVFASLAFLGLVIKPHLLPSHHFYLYFLVGLLEPLLGGAMIGIAVAASLTGGFTHKLMKAPQEPLKNFESKLD